MDTVAARSRIPPQVDITWDNLDKAKYCGLTTVMGTGIATVINPALYVAISAKMAEKDGIFYLRNIMTTKGISGSYMYGFGRTAAARIPAMVTHFSTLETTKVAALNLIQPLNLSQLSQVAVSNGAAGAIAVLVTRSVFHPFCRNDIFSMVQENVVKVFREEGVRGLYRGFGLVQMKRAPKAAVWWATYGSSQHCLGRLLRSENEVEGEALSGWKIMGVQITGSAMAAVTSACYLIPFLNIEQGMKHDKDKGAVQVVQDLVSSKGLRGLYRNFGTSCIMLTIFRTPLIVSYEYIKRLSAKEKDD